MREKLTDKFEEDILNIKMNSVLLLQMKRNKLFDVLKSYLQDKHKVNIHMPI
jgi:hypothetical protein